MEANNDDSSIILPYYLNEDDIKNINKPKVKLVFNDSTVLYFALSMLEDINPSFLFSYSSINSSSSLIEIIMPSYIPPNLLLYFLVLFKYGLNHRKTSQIDEDKTLSTLLKISEFFQLREFSGVLIQDLLLKSLNSNNTFDLFMISYEKLTKDNQCHKSWFELFFRSLEKLGQNYPVIIQNIDILLALDHKVIDELLNKCFECLFNENYILVENGSNRSVSSNEFNEDNYFDNINNEYNSHEDLVIPKKNECTNNTYSNANFISIDNMTKLIDIYSQIKQSNNNIFELLTNEYMSLCSPSSINELNERLTPTFALKIPLDLDSFYEEYYIDIKLNGKQIVFIVFYKKNEDSFNVNMKLSNKAKCNSYLNTPIVDDKYTFKVITFLTSAFIEDDEYNQINVKSIANNKSSISIFKLCNFKQMINERTSRLNYNMNNKSNTSLYANFKINLKICHSHSIISSYLVKNYYKYYDDPKITKLSKDFVQLLLKNKHLAKKTEDEIVMGLINWLKDEINIREDINELIDAIKWEKVTESLLYEFYLKYCHMIYHEETEFKMVKLLQMKYSTKKMTNDEIVKQMFDNFSIAAKKLDYLTLFTANKKNEKMNMMYRSSFQNYSNKSSRHSFLKKKESTSQETIEAMLTQTNQDNSQANNLSPNINILPSSKLDIKEQPKKKEIIFQSQVTNFKLKNYSKEIGFEKVMIKEKAVNPYRYVKTDDQLNIKSYIEKKQNTNSKKALHHNNNSKFQLKSNSNNDLSISNIQNKSQIKVQKLNPNSKSMSQLVPSNKTTLNKSASIQKKIKLRTRNKMQFNPFVSFSNKSQTNNSQFCAISNCKNSAKPAEIHRYLNIPNKTIKTKKK